MLPSPRRRLANLSIVPVIALVFALSGGAWALAAGSNGAHPGSHSSGKSGKRGPKGPRGPQGPAGAGGPQGPLGPAGLSGPRGETGQAGVAGPSGANGRTVLNGTGAPSAAQGQQGDFYINTDTSEIYGPKSEVGWGGGISLKGAPGTTGPPGSGGKSVVTNSFDGEHEPGEPGEGPCAENGGAEFEVEGSGEVHYLCNGGGGGGDGVPETLKGSWSLGQVNALAAEEPLYLSISFDIPLASGPTVRYVKASGGNAAGCGGTVSEPAAESGNICVYAASEENLNVPRALNGFSNLVEATNNVSPDGTSGAVIKGLTVAAGATSAYGTWAVTP
jgi:hypothetical protein